MIIAGVVDFEFIRENVCVRPDGRNEVVVPDKLADPCPRMPPRWSLGLRCAGSLSGWMNYGTRSRDSENHAPSITMPGRAGTPRPPTSRPLAAKRPDCAPALSLFHYRTASKPVL